MLLDPVSSQFFYLNSTASFLWNHLAEPSTAEELAKEVCKSFDGAGFPETLSDVEQLLRQMASHGLVQTLD